MCRHLRITLDIHKLLPLNSCSSSRTRQHHRHADNTRQAMQPQEDRRSRSMQRWKHAEVSDPPVDLISGRGNDHAGHPKYRQVQSIKMN